MAPAHAINAGLRRNSPCTPLYVFASVIRLEMLLLLLFDNCEETPPQQTAGCPIRPLICVNDHIQPPQLFSLFQC